MQKHVFGHMRTMNTQSDQGLHCPRAESLATTESMNGEHKGLHETLCLRRKI